MKVRIGDIVPISTVDWKGHCCSTIFIAGCPFRCTYCSNAPLMDAMQAREMELDGIKAKIEDASPFIDGVIFSGGEPLMSPVPLKELARFAKSIGLKTAVHTNGYYPEVLKAMIDEKMLDAVMLDVKAVQDVDAYQWVVHKVMDESDIERLMVSAAICMDARIRGEIEYYEVRTVCFKRMNDSVVELQTIFDCAGGADAYIIVQGLADLTPRPDEFVELSVDELLSLGSSLKWVKPVWVRSRAGEIKVGDDTTHINASSARSPCKRC